MKVRRCLLGICFTLTALCSAVSAADFEIRGRHREPAGDDKYNRVYSVYAPELDWEGMQKFAAGMEWSGPGTTTIVCFFNDWRNTPDVTFTGMNFSDHFKDYWVAGYWFYPSGNKMFVKHPARKINLTYS